MFYHDLWLGNVMVDEQLENAWLIDFEGAVLAHERKETAGANFLESQKATC